MHSLTVWVSLALQNMPPKARAPEARMVFGWDQVSGVEFCTCSGPSRCLPTVCIPSCCIFSPDQGRATATISSRFGCMELSCHHQRTLSPMLQCCHFQHRAWEDTGRPPSWNLRTLIPLQGSIMRRYAILLLGHSSSFKSPLPISMRKQCPHCSGHHT